MKSNKNQKLFLIENSEKNYLKFLRFTKEGKYAPIEKSSLDYTRISEETEHYEVFEDEYYYSIS